MNRKDLEKVVRSYGGHVESDTCGDDVVLQCIAPLGHCWEPVLHSYVVTWRRGDSDWRDDAIQDAIERMEGGPELCDCPDCKDGTTDAVLSELRHTINSLA